MHKTGTLRRSRVWAAYPAAALKRCAVRLQKAFIDEQAAQCGYCMNGMIMNTKALLDKNPHPTEAEIRRALDGILCRCGSHLRVLRAIQRATV